MALFDSATMPETFRMGKSFSNNSGSTLSGNPKNFVELKSANGSQTDALRTASGQRANAQNNQGANAATGVTPNPNNQTPPLDLIRVNSYQGSEYQMLEVGTSVNDPRPNLIENGGQEVSDKFKGTPSFFNEYYLVRYHSFGDKDSANPTKLAVPEGEEAYKGMANNALYKNPTTSIIINTFNGLGRQGNYFEYPEKVYSYSDFLYLKNYNPYGNNKLITLRRFMTPVYDECRTVFKATEENKKFRRPIARALTYLNASGNNLSSLANFTVGIPTGAVSGKMNTTAVTTNPQSQGAKDVVNGSTQNSANENTITNTAYNLFSILSGNSSDNALANWTSQYDPWSSGQILQDLVYGPVNVINDSVIRKQGLTYTQKEMKVTFEYSLKAIEKINPKAAMLDILGNMLALTYNHAAFWGGENRYLIDRKNFPVVSPEGIFGALAGLKNGNLDAIQEFSKKFSGSFNNVTNNVSKFTEAFLEAGFDFTKLASSEGGKKILETAITAYAQNKGGLQDVFKNVFDGIAQRLTGNPTGEWHLQVGNPFSPIMMIGNLWCTSSTFTFNNELSFDDFPTELKVDCTLNHGRSRDASDIQSIFNGGGGRIYYPYKNAEINPNASSSTFNTETAVVFKPDNLVGAWNAVTTDRSGLTIESIATKAGEGSKKDVAKQIMQTVNNYTGKKN